MKKVAAHDSFVLLGEMQYNLDMNRTVTNGKKNRGATGEIPGIPSLRDPKARLAAFRAIRGMWKNRKPDPIKELKKMRKEWERKLPW